MCFASIFVLTFTLLSSFPSAIAQENNPLSQITPPKLPGPGTSSNPELVNFFLYYNASNPGLHDVLHPGDIRSISTSHFKTSSAGPINGENGPGQFAVIFLIHGYFNQYDNEKLFVDNVKNALLCAGFSNIIAVDWQELAGSGSDLVSAGLNYINIESSGAQITGGRICKMILFLIRQNFINAADEVYLIGHSLGAHVAGVAGRCVRKKNKEPVGRITGLDPSIFFGLTSGGLVKTDAAFVDIVHTGQGSLGTYWQPAHLSYYVNGGWFPKQSNCVNFTQLSNPLDFITNLFGIQCAHFRAYELFAHSIRDPKEFPNTDLVGCRCQTDKPFVLSMICVSPRDTCKDKVDFGFYVESEARGRYYVDVSKNLLAKIRAQSKRKCDFETSV